MTRGRSRADVVVRGPFWSIVLEVKVDAGEGDGQCQRLFDDWSEDPDPRFVFLTRTGYHPYRRSLRKPAKRGGRCGGATS